MTPNKITFGSWDGNPTVLASFDDGSMAAFEHNEGAWREVHPADVFTKAAVVSEADFKRRWPDVGLPNLSE
jgi:hypothetical protein